MPKTILLAGAPELHNIKEEDLTVEEWLPLFAKFLDRAKVPDVVFTSYEIEEDVYSPTDESPAWRAITLEQGHLPTGWSQRGWLHDTFAVPSARHAPAEAQMMLSETTSHCFYDDENSVALDALTQFLEHSYTLHEAILSTQVAVGHEFTTPHVLRKRNYRALTLESPLDAPHSNLDDSIATSSSYSASPTTTTSYAFETPTNKAIWNTSTHIERLISAPQLHDLAVLPSAAHLSSIEPQTITVDLIVGVISLAAARTVTIRRTGGCVDLIEMLVGDETRAGFGITFWVTPKDDRTANNDHQNMDKPVVDTLRQSIESLRPGDIVLLRNIALSHFRRVVYGQSMRKTARGWETSVSLLQRPGNVMLDSEGRALSLEYSAAPLVAKMKRVVYWTRQFVSVPGAGSGAHTKGIKRRRELELEDDLPPDDTPQ